MEEAAGRVLSIYAGSMLNYMIDIGHRTGLLTAAAAAPATSQALAERAGLNERYVREWLGAMVTGGIVDYDPATGTYVGPDGRGYDQSDLAHDAPKEKTWQSMLTPPTQN